MGASRRWMRSGAWSGLLLMMCLVTGAVYAAGLDVDVVDDLTMATKTVNQAAVAELRCYPVFGINLASSGSVKKIKSITLAVWFEGGNILDPERPVVLYIDNGDKEGTFDNLDSEVMGWNTYTWRGGGTDYDFLTIEADSPASYLEVPADDAGANQGYDFYVAPQIAPGVGGGRVKFAIYPTQVDPPVGIVILNDTDDYAGFAGSPPAAGQESVFTLRWLQALNAGVYSPDYLWYAGDRVCWKDRKMPGNELFRWDYKDANHPNRYNEPIFIDYVRDTEASYCVYNPDPIADVIVDTDGSASTKKVEDTTPPRSGLSVRPGTPLSVFSETDDVFADPTGNYFWKETTGIDIWRDDGATPGVYDSGDTQMWGGTQWTTAAGSVGYNYNIYENGNDIWIDRAGGRTGVYDDGVDFQVYDGGDGWSTSDGTAGANNNLYYRYQYDPQDTAIVNLVDGGAIPAATAGFKLVPNRLTYAALSNYRYHDVNENGAYDDGEDIINVGDATDMNYFGDVVLFDPDMNLQAGDGPAMDSFTGGVREFDREMQGLMGYWDHNAAPPGVNGQFDYQDPQTDPNVETESLVYLGIEGNEPYFMWGRDLVVVGEQLPEDEFKRPIKRDDDVWFWDAYDGSAGICGGGTERRWDEGDPLWIEVDHDENDPNNTNYNLNGDRQAIYDDPDPATSIRDKFVYDPPGDDGFPCFKKLQNQTGDLTIWPGRYTYPLDMSRFVITGDKLEWFDYRDRVCWADYRVDADDGGKDTELRATGVAEDATPYAAYLGSYSVDEVLVDLDATWDVGWHDGYLVEITAGTGQGQIRRIQETLPAGNITDEQPPLLVVATPWDTLPDDTSAYKIYAASTLGTTMVWDPGEPIWVDDGNRVYDEVVETGLADGGAAYLLIDDDKLWREGQYKNLKITITNGTGNGQERTISDITFKRDWGYVSVGGTASLTDETKAWTANQWVGYYVIIADGRGSGQVRQITGNTATMLEVASPWTIGLNSTSVYWIVQPMESGAVTLGTANTLKDNTKNWYNPGAPFYLTGRAEAGTLTTLTDNDASWSPGALVGCVLTITGGAGEGQVRVITANDATTLTVEQPFTAAPGANSDYEISQWKGRVVIVTKDGMPVQRRRIVSNTADTLTVLGNWDVVPDGSFSYMIVAVNTVKVTEAWDTVPDATSEYSIGDNIIYDPQSILYDGYGTGGEPTAFLYCYQAGRLAYYDVDGSHTYNAGVKEWIVRMGYDVPAPTYEEGQEPVTSDADVSMEGWIEIVDSCSSLVPGQSIHHYIVPDTGTGNDGAGHSGPQDPGGEIYTDLMPSFSLVGVFRVRLGGRAATESGNVVWDWLRYAIIHRGNWVNDDDDYFDPVDNTIKRRITCLRGVEGYWLVDEEWRNGRDDDGDGLIDEDCADYDPMGLGTDLSGADIYHIYVYHDEDGDGVFSGADAELQKYPNYTDANNPAGAVPLYGLLDAEDGGLGITLDKTTDGCTYFIVFYMAAAGDTAPVEYGLDFAGMISLRDFDIDPPNGNVKATRVPNASFDYQGNPISHAGEVIYRHYGPNGRPDTAALLSPNSFVAGTPTAKVIAQVEYTGNENEFVFKRGYKPTCVCRSSGDVQVLDPGSSPTPLLSINLTDTPGGNEQLESVDVFFAPVTFPASGGRGHRGCVVTPLAQAGTYTLQVWNIHPCPVAAIAPDANPVTVTAYFTVTLPDGNVDYGMVEVDYDEDTSGRNILREGEGTSFTEYNPDFVTSDGGLIIPWRNYIDPMSAGTVVFDTTDPNLVSDFDPTRDLMPLADDDTSGVALYKTVAEGVNATIWSLTQGIVDVPNNELIPISVQESEWYEESHPDPALSFHKVWRLHLKPTDGIDMPDDDDSLPEVVLAVRTAQDAHYNSAFIMYLPDNALEFTHNISPGRGADRIGPFKGTRPSPPPRDPSSRMNGWVTFFKTGRATPTYLINPPVQLTDLTQGEHKVPANSPPVPVIGINVTDNGGRWWDTSTGADGYKQRISSIVLRFDQVYEQSGESIWIEDPAMEDGIFQPRYDLIVYGEDVTEGMVGTALDQDVYFIDENGDGEWNYQVGTAEPAWIGEQTYDPQTCTLILARPSDTPQAGVQGILVPQDQLAFYFYDANGDGAWQAAVIDQDFTYTDLADLKQGVWDEGVDAYTSGVALYRDMPNSDNIGAFDDPTDPNVVVPDEIVPMQPGFPRWSSMLWEGWPHTLVMHPAMDGTLNPNGIPASDLNDLPDDDSGTDRGDDFFIVIRTSSTITLGDDFRVHLGTNSRVAAPGVRRRWGMTDVGSMNALEFLPHPNGYSTFHYDCRPCSVPLYLYSWLYDGRFSFKRMQTGVIRNSTITTTVFSDKVAEGTRVDASSPPVPMVGINVYDNPGANETLDGVRVYFEDVSRKAVPEYPFDPDPNDPNDGNGGIRIIYVSPGTDITNPPDAHGVPPKTIEYDADTGRLRWDNTSGAAWVSLGVNVQDDSDVATTYRFLEPASGTWTADWVHVYALDDGTGAYNMSQALVVSADDKLDASDTVVRAGKAHLVNFDGADHVLFDDINGVNPGESDWDPEEDIWIDTNLDGRYNAGEPLLYVGSHVDVQDGQPGVNIVRDVPGRPDVVFLDTDGNGAYDAGEPLVAVPEGGVQDGSDLTSDCTFLNPGPGVPNLAWNVSWRSCYVLEDDETDNGTYDPTEAIVESADGNLTSVDAVVDSGQADLTLLEAADSVLFDDTTGDNDWDETDSIWLDVDGSGTYTNGDTLLYGSAPALGTVGYPFDKNDTVHPNKDVVFLDSDHDGAYDAGEPLMRVVIGGTYKLEAADGEYIIVSVDPDPSNLPAGPGTVTNNNIEIHPGNSFDPLTDLATLSTDETSGVLLYMDSNDPNGINGEFDPTDVLVPLGATSWGQDKNGWYVDLIPVSGQPVPDDDLGDNAGADYFVCVRTSDDVDYLDAFRAKVYWNGVTYSSGPSTASGNVTTKWVSVNVPTTLTDIAGTYEYKVPPSSEPVAVIGMNMRDNGLDNALASVTVFFYNNGNDTDFTAGDLMPLTMDETSGVAIYRDNPYAGKNGIFDPADIFLQPRTLPQWGGGLERRTVTINIADRGAPGLYDDAPIPDDDANENAGNDYFVVIRTSSAISVGDDFIVGIVRDGVIDGVNFKDGWSGESVATGAITCDLGGNVAPTLTITQPGSSMVTGPGSLVEIRWDDFDPEEDATISLYYDTDNQGFDGTEIITGIHEDQESGVNDDPWNDGLVDEDPPGDYDFDGNPDDDGDGQVDEDGGDFYLWNTEGLDTGTYYIYAKIDDGVNPPLWVYAPGAITLNHPPSIEVIKPDVDEMAADTFTIEWRDEDLDDNADITLYYDTDNQGYDGTPINAQPIKEDNSEDRYQWDITQVPYGDYYIYAMITDGKNPPAYSYSTGRVQVRHKPVVTVSAPAAGELVRGTYRIQYSATDMDQNQTALLDISIYYRKASETDWIEIAKNTDNTGFYDWETPVDAIGENYVLKVVARDPDGYEGSYTTGEFVIDNVDYQITGRVTLQGVDNPDYSQYTVSVNYDGATVSYNRSNGAYVISHLPPGKWVVTPDAPGYEFLPGSASVEVGPGLPNPATGVDFVGTAIMISGRVDLVNDDDDSGVTVTLDNGLSAVTDSTGLYKIAPVPAGTYTVIPQKEGYIFDPPSRSPIVVPPSDVNVDFDGYYVKGQITSIRMVPSSGDYPFDVEITWEGKGGIPYTYDVLVSDTVDGLSDPNARTVISVNPAEGTLSFVDDGSQTGAHPSTVNARFYAISVKDSRVSDIVGIYKLTLNEGTNYISLPLAPFGDASFDALLDGQLTGGTVESESDRIYRWHRGSATFEGAWFDSVTEQWMRAADSPSMELVFHRDEGLRVDVLDRDGQPGTVDVFFVGRAGSADDIDLDIAPGLSLVGVTYHEAMSSEAPQYSTDPRQYPVADDLAPADNAATADRLWVWNVDHFEYYWLNADGHWYHGNSPVTLTFQPGGGYWVQKRGVDVDISSGFPGTVEISRTANPITDADGAPLAGDGSTSAPVVQLLWAGPDGQVSRPSGSGGSTGDDVLLARAEDAESYVSRIGYGFPGGGDGLFSDDFSLRLPDGGTVPVGSSLYIRVWNASSVADATHYVDSDVFTLNALQVVIDGVSMGQWQPKPDDVAPAPVSNLTAEPAGHDDVGKVLLKWQNPTDADFAGVLIVRALAETAFTDPVSGISYTVGSTIGDAGAEVVGITGPSATSFEDADPALLTDGTVYYYAVYAFDTSYNYSAGRFAHSVAQDNPPVIIKPIPDVEGDPGRVLMLDVTGYAEDDIDKEEDLLWSVEGADYCDPVVTGSVIWFEPKDRDFKGRDEVTVIVTDSRGQTDSQKVYLTWRKPSKPGGGGGCFIATAAFGSPAAGMVPAYRHVRDSLLLQEAAGRRFVDTYYGVSPEAAGVLRKMNAARAVVRRLLMSR